MTPLKRFYRPVRLTSLILTIAFITLFLFTSRGYAYTQTQTELGASALTRLYFSVNEQPTVLLLNNNQVVSNQGFKDAIVIKGKEDDVHKQSNSEYAIVTNAQGKQGYINSKGDWLLTETFDVAKAFNDEGIARVKQEDQWFFIDRQGNHLFNKTFAAVSPFSKGYAAVKEKEGVDIYFINMHGKNIFNKTFMRAGAFADNGLASVGVGEPIIEYLIGETETSETTQTANIKYGYINTKGEFAIPPQFNKAYDFNSFGIAKASVNEGVYFLINEHGKAINDERFDYDQRFKYIGAFSKNGFAKATTADSDFEGIINHKGERLFKVDNYRYTDEYNGLIQSNGYFYNTSGEKVIEHTTWAEPFYHESVTLALKGGKWGLLTIQDIFTPFAKDIIAPLTYHKKIVGFVDGILAMIDAKGDIMYFDTQGDIKYQFVKSQNGNMQLVDKTGKLIWQSDIDNQNIDSIFNPNDSKIIKSERYKDGVLPMVEAMLNSEPKPYYVPNPLFSEENPSPYAITDEIIEDEEVKMGVIDIVAIDYVDAQTYGYYEFLPEVRGNLIPKIHQQIIKEVSSKYGEPKANDSDYWQSKQWHIGGKTLSFSWQSDAGDGDYYNQLVLELNDSNNNND